VSCQTQIVAVANQVIWVSVVKSLFQVGFQIDARLIELLANQIRAERVSANHRASSEHQFENQSKHLLIDVIRNLEHQTMVI